MTIQFPVHPDDVEMLLKIRRYLIGHRITNGWTQQQLSQMISGTNGMVYDLESNVTWQWRLSRLQDWVVPFELRLSAKVEFPLIGDHDPLTVSDEFYAKTGVDLTWMVESDPEVAPLLSLSRRPGAWPKWQRMYLTSALSVARRHLEVSTDTMARRLGVTRKAINAWERAADEIMLPKALQYARTLGGYIQFGLDDIEGTIL